MTRMIATISLYVLGFIAFAFAGIYQLVLLDLTKDAEVLALMVASPVILWAYAAVYQYMFDGICIACVTAFSAGRSFVNENDSHMNLYLRTPESYMFTLVTSHHDFID
jgi:hypothetical protein